ncbi:MAG: S26 family signal peptidase [Candidatus Omnitrophica bacterium]|nr:S26 family signal peptidase [Candidatus Omnitrophota bacterium]
MKYMSAKLIGNSMEPLLKIGDALLIKKADYVTFAIGDIVVFENSDNSKLITHRILSINPDGSLMTKPDSTLVQADAFRVPYDKIKGKVIAAYRGTDEIPIEDSGRFIKRAQKLFVFLNNSKIYARIKTLSPFKWLHRKLSHARLRKTDHAQCEVE